LLQNVHSHPGETPHFSFLDIELSSIAASTGRIGENAIWTGASLLARRKVRKNM